MKENRPRSDIRPLLLSALAAGMFAPEIPGASAQSAGREAATRMAEQIVTDRNILVDGRGAVRNEQMWGDLPQGPTLFASFHTPDPETGRERLVIASIAAREGRPSLYIETCYNERELGTAFTACGDDTDGHIVFRDDGIDGTLDYGRQSIRTSTGGEINNFYWRNRNDIPAEDRRTWENEYDTLGLGAITRHIMSVEARRST